jgi:hypothetical protein
MAVRKYPLLASLFLFSVVKVASGLEKFPRGSLLTCAKELRDISVFPGEERYNQSLPIYNPAYGHLQPGFFALPKSEEDVQRCLKCTYEYNVPIVIKSGGHCEAGYSTIGSDGIVIYLSEMNKVDIDRTSKVVHVEAGARWENIYSKTYSSYIVVGGLCPTVGVSGYTMGGGHSVLARYHGLAIDNLISVTTVTANGSGVVVANSTVHPDLFWALRGGGGGNFGVVTKFTFQLHPTHPNYVYGTLRFEGHGVAQFLEVLSTAVQPLPKEINLGFFIFPSKSYLKPFYIGDYTDVIKILKPFTEIATQVSLKNYSSYDQVLSILGKHAPAVSSLPEVMKSCMLNEISKDVARIFSEIELPESCRISFSHYGGAVKDHAANETAYPHRNASYDCYTKCLYSNASELAEVSQFQENLFSSLIQGGHCAGGYINNVDRQVSDWQHFYYGGNYDRLVEIKQKWNPIGSGTLHFLQEIGSDYQPTGSSRTTLFTHSHQQ